MPATEILDFLGKYSLAQVDPQTTIITQIIPTGCELAEGKLSRCVYGPREKGPISESTSEEGTRSPLCYLVKDMIIPEDNEAEMLTTAMQTLAVHKKIHSKYILTLLNYEAFTKYAHTTDASPPEHAMKTSQYSLASDTHCASKISHLQTRHNEEPHNSRSRRTYEQEADISLAGRASRLEEKPITRPCKAIRAVYQYGVLTVKEEIQNRILSQTQFEEEELWAILATIIQALAYLQEGGITYGVLGTDKIFINDSLVKILDPSGTATDPLLITQGRLYSPEILKGEPEIDMFRSDIYVTGLILIECGLLIDLSKQVEANPVNYLSMFGEIYSQQLVEVIEMCLAYNPEDRPSFEELQEYLGKELDMNDFSNAYSNIEEINNEPLQPDAEDQCDLANYQFEPEEPCMHDILMEGFTDEDELANVRVHRNLTDYEKAMMKYLGDSKPNKKSERNSLSSQESRLQNGQRSHSYNRFRRKQNFCSPEQTHRNNYFSNKFMPFGQYLKNVCHSNAVNLPSLDMPISTSICDNEIVWVPISTKNRQSTELPKTNRKLVIKEQRDENMPGNQHTVVNKNQLGRKNRYADMPEPENMVKNDHKIKKTKLIKEKLVKRYQDQALNNKQARELQRHYEARTVLRQDKAYPENQSIQQQADESSESSCLYPDTHTDRNPRGIQQLPVPSMSMRSSRHMLGSTGSGNSSNMRQSSHFEEPQSRPDRRFNKNSLGEMDCNIFTNPHLMKTVKQDLQKYRHRQEVSERRS